MTDPTVVLAVALRRWIIGGPSTDIVKGEATRTHAFRRDWPRAR
jgi:hypothetical protein